MPDPAPRKDAWKTAEVCKTADVAPYVLKYWLTEFPVLSADKDKGPNRLFTAREVDIISRIRQLLYDEGFTIAGAKKKIEAEIAGGEFDEGTRGGKRRPAARSGAEPAASPVPAVPPTPNAPRPESRAAAEASAIDKKTIVRELKDILKTLDKPIAR